MQNADLWQHPVQSEIQTEQSGGGPRRRRGRRGGRRGRRGRRGGRRGHPGRHYGHNYGYGYHTGYYPDWWYRRYWYNPYTTIAVPVISDTDVPQQTQQPQEQDQIVNGSQINSLLPMALIIGGLAYIATRS